MPLDNDMACFGGREWLGLPKKIATINFEKNYDIILGSVERKGVEFAKIKGDLSSNLNNSESEEIISKYLTKKGFICYNFKNLPDMDGINHWFPYKMRVKAKLDELKFGNGELLLSESKHDAWSDIKVEEILGGVYMHGNINLNPPNFFKEIDEETYRPHAFIGWDF